MDAPQVYPGPDPLLARLLLWLPVVGAPLRQSLRIIGTTTHAVLGGLLPAELPPGDGRFSNLPETGSGRLPPKVPGPLTIHFQETLPCSVHTQTPDLAADLHRIAKRSPVPEGLTSDPELRAVLSWCWGDYAQATLAPRLRADAGPPHSAHPRFTWCHIEAFKCTPYLMCKPAAALQTSACFCRANFLAFLGRD